MSLVPGIAVHVTIVSLSHKLTILLKFMFFIYLFVPCIYLFIYLIYTYIIIFEHTVVPAGSGGGVMLFSLAKWNTNVCTSLGRARINIDRLCIDPILWIGLVHGRYIDSKSLIIL